MEQRIAQPKTSAPSHLFSRRLCAFRTLTGMRHESSYVPGEGGASVCDATISASKHST